MNAVAPALNPPSRLLMGPGPSAVHPRVLQAMGMPTLGHLDPEYLRIMNAMQDMLRAVFQTQNEMTLAISGTGSAGMETTVVNLLEPGDTMLVCVNGVFGQRMTDVAERTGAKVVRAERPWGEVFTPEDIRQALTQAGPAGSVKVVGIVMAETSTGASQPLAEIAQVVHDAGALLLVDAVTALGGMPVEVDAWGIDAIYAGTQKCLSCPPGLAPVSFSPRAMEVIRKRQTKAQSWYLDVSMLASYWGSERVYHHTAPINMTYGLYEALRILLEEGLEAAYARHHLNSRALKAGLEALGLSYAAQADHRLPMLHAVWTPAGIDEASVRTDLLNRFGIEIGSGLGTFKGRAWRIGLMGHAAQANNVLTLLAALEQLFAERGHAFQAGSSIAAANSVYSAKPLQAT